MKTYFIAGEMYDNYDEFNCVGPLSRLIVAASAKDAWDIFIAEVELEGGVLLIKEIKVVE